MSDSKEWADIIIADIEEWNPKIIDLATPLSLAVRIEPELLRSIRFKFQPQLDASIEADLWFSDLVEYRSLKFIVFKQAILESLRSRLQSKSEQLKKARDIIQELHRTISPALQLEEEIIWITLAENGNPARINAEINKVIATLVNEERNEERKKDIAFWASNALIRLPEEAKKTESAWALQLVSSQYIPHIKPIDSEVPQGIFNQGLSYFLKDIPEIEIGIYRNKDQIIINTTKNQSHFLITVPDTIPIVLELTYNQSLTSKYISFTKDSRVSKQVDNGKVFIRTITDKTYTLPADKQDIKRIKILLAASSELMEERHQLEILINLKNNKWHSQGVFLELVIWEDYLDFVSEEHQKAIHQSDILILLSHIKSGRYTLNEFETAFGQYKATNKPYIYFYIKESPNNKERSDKEEWALLWELQNKLETFKYFWSKYEDNRDLINQLSVQLERWGPFSQNNLAHIFVSSTYKDLNDYRWTAEQAINELGQIYEGMENMDVGDEELTKACLDLVAKSDLIVGLYAWRYGRIPEGYNISITEQEYRHAQQLQVPCLCYFADEDYNWNPQYIDQDLASKKLSNFKNTISQSHIYGKFTSPESLKVELIRDISRWLVNNRSQFKWEGSDSEEDPVEKYFEAIIKKYSTFNMPSFGRNLSVDSIFIPLTMHVNPESRFLYPQSQTNEIQFNRSIYVEDLINLPEKIAVILGAPGTGKTTLLQYLVTWVSQKAKKMFPIIVKLADFSKTSVPLESFLLTSVGNMISNSTILKVARKAFQRGQALVLLDGLDEIGREDYITVTERIRDFIALYPECRVIITSRKAGFQAHEVPYLLFEIDKLSLADIETFINKWFEKGKNDLIARIATNNRIRELAQNPFMLSIICLVFEKDHSLSQRRVELYHKCTVTLLTLYDERQVPKKNRFNRLDKEQVLEDLAYYFFREGKDEFPYQALIEQIRRTKKRLKQNYNEEEILQEIRENSGLLQKSDDNHLFTHRTFYEYYVSRKMHRDSFDIVLSRTNESRWEEPIRLYAAQIDSIIKGTQFIRALWEKDRALALRCYPDMEWVAEPEFIKNLLNQANVDERVELVRGLPEKIAEPEKIVETLHELFRWETNGEVIYRGIQILEKNENIKKIPGATEIVRQKLDDGSQERYQKYVANDMIRIPAGEFFMGSEENENEKPVHEVKLDSFFMSRYQVTNQLYEKFDPNHRQYRDKYSDKDGQPVIYISWYEAFVFCRWLGCRLPTEEEWEYACRAGTITPFNTGDTLTTDQANYNGNYPYINNPRGEYIGKTRIVGSYPPNAWGLFDMHGNVWEWCRDWYEQNYSNGSPKIEAKGFSQGVEILVYHVLRGGSWNDDGQYCRSATRHSTSADSRYSNTGFRLVYVP